MDARKLNRRIEFFAVDGTGTPDGFGGFLDVEVLLVTTWAQVRTLSKGSAERYKSQGLDELQHTAEFVVRRREDVDLNASNLTIKYKGARYKILSVEDVDINRYFITILARKEKIDTNIPTPEGGGQGFPYTFD